MIYDFLDDRSLGRVIFEPFLRSVPITATPTATPTTQCTWAGQWDTQASGQNFVLTLQEAASVQPGARSVFGGYGADGRRIEAMASGSGLTGRWSGPPSFMEPDHAGRLAFTLSADCGGFTGTWGLGGAATGGGAWTGRRITADPARTALVVDAYRANLCRDPDTGGREYWTAGGADRAGVEAAIRGSAEWAALQPARNAYLAVLARDPLAGDCAGLFYWAGAGLSQAAIEGYLAPSPEGVRVRAVRDLYIELLGRDPLPDDRLALRGWVDSGFSLDDLRRALMASDEYRQRHPGG